MVNTLQKSLTINQDTAINARRHRNAYDTFCSSGGVSEGYGSCPEHRVLHDANRTPCHPDSFEAQKEKKLGFSLNFVLAPHQAVTPRQETPSASGECLSLALLSYFGGEDQPIPAGSSPPPPPESLSRPARNGAGRRRGGVKGRAGRRTVRYKA